MERGLSFVTTSSSRPSCFFSDGRFCQSQKLHRPADTPLRRKPISVKAIKQSPSSSSSSGRKPKATLSADWTLSGFSVPTTLPRFEELDTTNTLLRQRIVFLGSPLDEITADLIVSQLLFLDAEDPKKDIKLFINSPGGSITAGMGIYDAMKLCKADVSTVCFGVAASMSGFLLASGTKGKRFCMPNARVMIHQARAPCGGTPVDFAIRAREIYYERFKVIKILSRITGKPEEQIKEDTHYENFMNPWEAVKYGLVDAVIDDGKPGLVAPIAEAIPLPKNRVWHLWKVDGSIDSMKNLPSEERMLQIKNE